ncbi:hypothetical protein [Agaricicola taiwanensis]|nr:hypothetical protein [Agaricicola taiwanensis]
MRKLWIIPEKLLFGAAIPFLLGLPVGVALLELSRSCEARRNPLTFGKE